MRKWGVLLLAAMLLTALALGAGAEEFFAEESFSGEESFTDEGFFEEEFFAEEPGEDVTEEALPEEPAEELEDRSVATLNIDQIEMAEDGSDWWKTAPVLEAAWDDKKAGQVKLSWVQPDIADKKLDKVVKYYVYAYDNRLGIGAACQVGKPVSAAKKPVTVALDSQSFTGLGASVTLKKQKTGTTYFVRTEKITKTSEEYGKSSNTVAYEGYEDDNKWKKIRSDGSDELIGNYVYLTWTCTNLMKPRDGIVDDFIVERTTWIMGEKQPAERIELVFPSNYQAGFGHHGMHDILPEGTTKVTYKVTPVRNGKKGNTFTKTMTIKPPDWTNVYEFSAGQHETDLAVWLHWKAYGEMANQYKIGGLSGAASISWNGQRFVPNLDKNGETSINSLSYNIYWTDVYGEAHDLSVVEGYDGNDDWAILEESYSDGSLKAAFANMGPLDYAEFWVLGPVKSGSSLNYKLSVQPQLGKKTGTKATDTAYLECYWMAGPSVEASQNGIGQAKLITYLADFLSSRTEGVRYEIKGFAKPIVLEVVEAAQADYLSNKAGEYGLKLISGELESLEINRSQLTLCAQLTKTGKVTFTVQAQRKEGKKTLKGETGKATATILGLSNKAGALLDRDLYKKVIFTNLNPKAVFFRVSTVNYHSENDGYGEVLEFPAASLDAQNQREGLLCWWQADDERYIYGVPDKGDSAIVQYNPKTHRYLVEMSDMTPFAGAMVETFLADGTRIVDKNISILNN